MNLEKLISELQERNRESFMQKFANDDKSLKEELQQLFVHDITTDTAHQVALAVIGEIKEMAPGFLITATGKEPQVEYDVITQEYLARIETLEAKIKE